VSASSEVPLWSADNPIEARAVGCLRVGELVLAGTGGTFRHGAKQCPIAEGQSNIGGGINFEAKARRVGQREIKRAADKELR
jgi:hypothetical protein